MNRTLTQCKSEPSRSSLTENERLTQDSSIEPTDVCVKLSDGVSKYESRVYGQHLLSKVKKNFHSGTGAVDIPKAVQTSHQTLIAAGV